MIKSPYAYLPPERYWHTGVCEWVGTVPQNLWTPKWPFTREIPIATAGSCFAQHIGRTLRKVGFNVLDVEPAPTDLPEAQHLRLGYGMYSARYGNIYTPRQFLQLAREAFGLAPMSTEVWQIDSGYVDALRPTIDPVGFGSPEAVHLHRKRHLNRVRQMLLDVEVFVFTFGLTEAWLHSATGTVYPVCPGTAGGTFDPDLHVFHNFGYPEILSDFEELRDLLNTQRDGKPLRFLVTVSPVPLIATAAPQHVQVSTVYSKSVLRAVAGMLSDTHVEIDYFPSYEIITSPWSELTLYEPNKRSVSSQGVAMAMAMFADAHKIKHDIDVHLKAKPRSTGGQTQNDEDHDMLVKCDEELLDSFEPKKT